MQYKILNHKGHKSYPVGMGGASLDECRKALKELELIFQTPFYMMPYLESHETKQLELKLS